MTPAGIRRVCLAGATGWAGSALAAAIARATDLKLVAGVSRTHAGRNLGDVLGLPALDAPVFRSVEDALDRRCDVFVEYTRPEVAKRHVRAAIERGVHVVIGTSGLSDPDLDEIHDLAVSRRVGVLAVGNFALTNMVLQKCAELAARWVPHWEILDYADAGKPDAPSGTARELAYRLARIRTPEVVVPVERILGSRESRGASLNGTQVHSIRLPGHVIGLEIAFGLPHQRLVLRCEAGTSAEPYVQGALLAIRRVGTLVGLRRGLDTVMDEDIDGS